jgi:hypothetical protein
MHKCRENRETLLARVLDKTGIPANQTLMAEIGQCAVCREEYASLNRILRVADQAMEAAQPPESFWSSYHARLKERLESEVERKPGSAGRAHSLHNWISAAQRMPRRLVSGYIRVPIPIAACLIVLFTFTILFGLRSRSALISMPPNSSQPVVTKVVETPVVRERTVTRVVYLERKRSGKRGLDAQTNTQPMRDQDQPARIIPARHGETRGRVSTSLVGFKPAEDVKLTITKGGYRDDK